jgi:sigma-E factor negative regulatory protein RseA
MVKSEDISALMDGELEPERLDAICAALREREAIATWATYHIVGDALRRECLLAPGFAARFAGRLANEPTVLAPRPRRAPIRRVAWALAATIAGVTAVGWVALQQLGSGEPSLIATARQAQDAQSIQLRRQAGGGLRDYLVVHQEFSPAAMVQGELPAARTVADRRSPGMP